MLPSRDIALIPLPVLTQPCALAGAVGYGVASAQRSVDDAKGMIDGVAAAGNNAAAGLGKLLGSIRSGLNVGSSPPQPTVTHIYHDSGSGRSSALSVIVVAGGVSLVGYYGVCWWKGWDFFGVSHARTVKLIEQVRKGAPPFCLVTLHARVAAGCSSCLICTAVTRFASCPNAGSCCASLQSRPHLEAVGPLAWHCLQNPSEARVACSGSVDASTDRSVGAHQVCKLQGTICRHPRQIEVLANQRLLG
jgi:hypothetical protein